MMQSPAARLRYRYLTRDLVYQVLTGIQWHEEAHCQRGIAHCPMTSICKIFLD
jgi:hypothetical protein